MSCDVAVNEATCREDRGHAVRISADIFVEISHQYDVMAVTSQIRDQGGQIGNEDLSRVGIVATFKAKHVALLGVSGSAARGAGLLRDLIDRDNN